MLPEFLKMLVAHKFTWLAWFRVDLCATRCDVTYELTPNHMFLWINALHSELLGVRLHVLRLFAGLNLLLTCQILSDCDNSDRLLFAWINCWFSVFTSDSGTFDLVSNSNLGNSYIAKANRLIPSFVDLCEWKGGMASRVCIKFLGIVACPVLAGTYQEHLWLSHRHRVRADVSLYAVAVRPVLAGTL